MSRKNCNQKSFIFYFLAGYNRRKGAGFIAIIITVIVLVAILSISLSITFLTASEQRIIKENINALQSYYLAESGVEDALLRVFSGEREYSDSYNFSLDEGEVNVLIDEVSSSLTIESTGNKDERIKKIEVKAIESSDETNFHYGVQVGEGGLDMEGNSKITGNVYSNGPMDGASNTRVEGDAYSAGSSGLAEDMNIYKSESGSQDGNLHSHSIVNCEVENGAYYQVIASSTAGSYHPASPDPEYEEMPIPESRINQWKDQAASGGTIGSYYHSSGTKYLGPVKIAGDITVTSNAVLVITGTVWVTGNILFDSNSIVELGADFGLNSGVILADGRITLGSNVKICGSEGHQSNKCRTNEGSFLMLLSTNSSLNPSLPAINSSSNSESAILYASNGLIVLDSNAELKEVTGYALRLNSNAVVSYVSGLASAKFSSGPSGGWEVVSWRESE